MKANIEFQDESTGAGFRPRVLLMDDEVTLGKGLEMVLEKEGYSVDYATTGRGALDYFGNNPYDLLVADLRLPDIDGMEVVKKAKGANPALQVIIITGYGSVPSAVGAMKLGVYDYLSKPFTSNEFVDSVHGALQERFGPMLRESAEKWERGAVSDRTAEKKNFRQDVLRTFEALGQYEIPLETKNAVVAGDYQWLRENIGLLSDHQFRSVLSLLETEATVIEKREVIKVLDRTTQDRGFWLDLLERGSLALSEYHLSTEAKGAIVSGDLKWIKTHIGELSEEQLRWILSRLEMERW